MIVLTLEKANETTTTGCKEIAPMILGTCSWMSGNIEVSVIALYW